MSAATVYTHTDEPFVHQALIYGSDREYLDTAGRFVQEGLAADEPAVVVTTRHNLDLLRELIDPYDDVQYIESDSWYLAPGATLGAYVRTVLAHEGNGRLRVIGEPVWAGRSELEIVEWTRYESVINATFKDMPTWILCPYDKRVLPDNVVTDAARTHPEVISGSNTWLSLAYRDPATFTTARDSRPLAPAVDPESFPITRDRLQAVRDFVTTYALERGMVEAHRRELLVAVNELATNVVLHGGGYGVVHAWQDGDDLVCDVVDEAGALTMPYPGQLFPSPDAPSGHGLWVARQLCDLMEVRVIDGRSVVRVRMALNGSQTRTPA